MWKGVPQGVSESVGWVSPPAVCLNEAIFHSSGTYQISALIRGSSWSPESLIVYSLENEGLVCLFSLLPFLLFPFPLSCHSDVSFYLGHFFFLYVVTYLCSLCLVWCMSLIQVWGRCVFCKLAMSFHSALRLIFLVLLPPFLPMLSSFSFSPVFLKVIIGMVPFSEGAINQKLI